MEETRSKKQIKIEENKKLEEDIIKHHRSYFTGDMKGYYFIRLVSLLSDIFSLGIMYPFITCWQMKWEAKHTFINGKRLEFTGNPVDVFFQFIKWWALTVVTFGIYHFIKGKFAIHKWKIKHTHFEGSEKGSKSVYKGSVRKYNKAVRRAAFIKAITIGLGASWTHCYIEKWSSKKTIIDGYQMSFNGSGREYFLKKTKWILYTILTLGIYSFWLVIKSKQWEVEHTHCKKIEKEQSIEEQERKILSEKDVKETNEKEIENKKEGKDKETKVVEEKQKA